MFTSLSKARNVNPYLIIAMAIMVSVLAIFVVPSTAAPKSAASSAIGSSDGLDYYQRHPELNASGASAVDMSDYFFRHPKFSAAANSIDLSDYFLRHPEFKAK